MIDVCTYIHRYLHTHIYVYLHVHTVNTYCILNQDVYLEHIKFLFHASLAPLALNGLDVILWLSGWGAAHTLKGLSDGRLAHG